MLGSCLRIWHLALGIIFSDLWNIHNFTVGNKSLSFGTFSVMKKEFDDSATKKSEPDILTDIREKRYWWYRVTHKRFLWKVLMTVWRRSSFYRQFDAVGHFDDNLTMFVVRQQNWSLRKTVAKAKIRCSKFLKKLRLLIALSTTKRKTSRVIIDVDWFVI